MPETTSQAPMLTWEEYAAGTPCPGCGRPYQDGVAWTSAGTMHLTDDERALFDQEQQLFRTLHPDCHAASHRVAGSLTQHCAGCCPPPPLSPETRTIVARLLSQA